MFAKFADIVARRTPRRQVRAEFGVDGFFCRHEKRFISWRVLQAAAGHLIRGHPNPKSWRGVLELVKT